MNRKQTYKNEGLLNITMPVGLTDTLLPDPYMLDYYNDLEERVMWVDGEINDGTLDVMRKILRWNKEDKNKPIDKRKPITLYFNSEGGYLGVSIAVAQCIKNSITPVIGINMGECSSGAALIYSQCHVRKSTYNGYWLVHFGSGGTEGDYKKMKRHQQHHTHLIGQMSKMLSDAMQIPLEEFEELADDEWYLYVDDTDPESIHNANRYNLTNAEM